MPAKATWPHGIARMPLGVKQLIELGLYGLGVAMLCALDEQSHEPDGNRGDAVPLERCWGKHAPQDCVAENDQERQRMGGQHAKVGQRTTEQIDHDTQSRLEARSVQLVLLFGGWD